MPKTAAKNYIKGKLCHYCGTAKASTIDHIVPKVWGGTYALWNIQPACNKCNHDKAADWPTCPCNKCRNAIQAHLADPYRVSITLRYLEVQERHDIENQDKVARALHKIIVQNEKRAEFRRHIRDLTARAQASKVDT